MRRWTEPRRGRADPAAAPPQGGYAEAAGARSDWPAKGTSAPRPWRDRLVAAALLAAAGAGAAFAQPPWSLWPLALAGWAFAIWVAARGRLPALAVWIFCAASFAVSMHWLVEPFLIDAAATGWLAPIALVAAAGGLAIFPAVGAGIGALLARRGPARAFAIGAGLGLGEMGRAWLLTGFPWGLPGHVWIDTAALPAAAYLGGHGLTLAVVVGAGLVAALRPAPLALGLAAWAAPWGLAQTLDAAPPPASDAPVLRLVQPNAPQAHKWDPDFVQLFWERGLRLTAGAGEVDAVVWPETALPALLGRSEDVRGVLARAAGGVPVAVGVQRYGPGGDPRNAMALLTGPRGDVALTYDKHHLVPFGEYLPLPAVARALGIGPLAAQLAGTYRPGDGPLTFDLPGVGTVMPLICYEAIFPQYLRGVERPRLLLHLTNDAWFGSGAGPRQHLALARLRAAESGLPLMRAANTGISAVIDARGRVTDALPLNEAGALDVAVPAALPPTPYARTGDLPWLGAYLLLLALAVAARPRARD